ncbi:MAG: hypothetical protein Q4F75_01905 [Pseudomonadota bacterium]|nr:hypothetical protein [Pseudomonadota bacterium]
MTKKMQTFAEYGFYVGSLKRAVSSSLFPAKERKKKKELGGSLTKLTICRPFMIFPAWSTAFQANAGRRLFIGKKRLSLKAAVGRSILEN